MEFANRCTVVHGIERSDLVDTSRGHLEKTSDLVHDGDGCKTMLALTQVEQWHHGGLLILRRVSLEDLGDECLILRVELERDIRVVVGGVSMLFGARRFVNRIDFLIFELSSLILFIFVHSRNVHCHKQVPKQEVNM